MELHEFPPFFPVPGIRPVRQNCSRRLLCLWLLLVLRLSTALALPAPGTPTGNVAKNYQHWADVATANWQGDILNAGKSDYFEGEVIPHVYVVQASNQKPLVHGQSYQFDIIYNYYQANTRAGGFAFVTTYNSNRQPGLLPEATGLTPQLDNTATAGSHGYFYTVDADVTGASAPVVPGGAVTKDARVTVTWTYTGVTTETGIAELYYGLAIAEPGRVPDQGAGTTTGASGWTGGSLQTTVDETPFSGALSIQLAPDAIIRGQISGSKYSDLNNNHLREADEPGLANWTFYLDANHNGTPDAGEATTTTDATGNFSFVVTPDADKSTPLTNDPYYVREVNQNGWTLTQPLAGEYGPILITAADPTESGLVFGNFLCLPPTIEAGNDQILSCATPNGQLTLTATASGAATYQWTTANGHIVSGASSLAVVVDKAGTYIFRATGALTCFSEDQVSVTEDLTPPSVSAGTDEVINCNTPNGQLTLTATASPSGTYAWTTTDGHIVSGASSLAVVVDKAGTYTFRATTSNGCYSEDQASVTKEVCGTQYCTLTQGFYGSTNGTDCASSLKAPALIRSLLATNLVIGSPGRSLTIGAADASCLNMRMPAGGAARALPTGNQVFGANCTPGTVPLKNGKFDNILLGQTITLGLNLRKATVGPLLQNLLIADRYMITAQSASCNKPGAVAVPGTERAFEFPAMAVGKTAQQLYMLANEALGNANSSKQQLSNLTMALDALNRGFDECRLLLNFQAAPLALTTTLSSFQQTAESSSLVSSDQFLHVYPNPLVGTATLDFRVRHTHRYSLVVYDMQGRATQRLGSGEAVAGQVYQFVVGPGLEESIYVVQLIAGTQHEMIRLVVQK